MKIEVKNDNNLIVFLNKKYTDKIDFSDRSSLESYFRQLFLKLKNNYQLKISGYYDINVYIDKYYGIILEMFQESIECFDYFNSIDMKVNIITNSEFLYQVNDFNKDYPVYIYRGKLYLRINKDISFIELGKIIENGIIIYGDMVDDVLKHGKIMIK
ncbi:MAG: hypothetical protein PHO63_05190 [Bacilli bacterium]|nr:hypothetical protein [Bacilli bacterium]MDD4808618.1 hypothetical protein [Bacilli bacterium]